MVSLFFKFIVIIFASIQICYCDSKCLKPEISITQKVEREGFHREIRWLIEATSATKKSWINSNCQFLLRLHIPSGMFVNPDEVAEFNRTRQLLLFIDGKVDVEAPAHEASEHNLYVFLKSTNFEKTSINIPIHLRYQRAQITGGYGKVVLKKPSLLLRCSNSSDKLCNEGLKMDAPCDHTSQSICVWTNLTYTEHFDEVELFVPVGDLDDYPLVSIVTLLLGCAGCVYILSVLSSAPF